MGSTILDRSRREAILRMKEEARGMDIIINLRITTSSISKGAKNTIGSIETLAYGTAITYSRIASLKPDSEKNSFAHDDKKMEITAKSYPVKKYKVIFSGKIAPGQDINMVKSKVASLYKIPVKKCEPMFIGHSVIIKNNVDYQTAQKYKKAFERTGALCHIKSVKLIEKHQKE